MNCEVSDNASRLLPLLVADILEQAVRTPPGPERDRLLAAAIECLEAIFGAAALVRVLDGSRHR